MSDYIDFYTESELDDLIDDIFEIEGVNRIKELSRQLRTFFNYKAELIVSFCLQAKAISL